MNDIGQPERNTQDRIIKLFQDLGYQYLGNWKDRSENSNLELELLKQHLSEARYSERLIDTAMQRLDVATGSQVESLYEANLNVYHMLRYGMDVRESQGQNKQTVHFIDWENPENNHFAIAEEITVQGEYDKRPDIVLYVNGIAVGILELKRSKVDVAKGIRQNLDNQQPEFIQSFFNTIQLILAGNDTQGLRYGTTGTPERYFQEWKEQTERSFDYKLDQHLSQLCRKDRFLELIKYFVLFDAGQKKICRPHQYFGVKAAQERVRDKRGGIIWHSQGSGKSLTMVWLAQWIREKVDDSRVLIITDRIELDKQIHRVFQDAGESMVKAKSGSDLIEKLNAHEYPLMCSLIHKFGAKEEGEYDQFIEDIQNKLPENFQARGDIHVFVDECHRTQSGKLHKAMKAFLPDAMFIGFTGTPLLKDDKKTSLEVFGPYIHTYKFDEAVEDNVVLDLRYEARDIDQKITDQESIDQWFEKETQGLNEIARQKLMKRWGTLKKLWSSKERLEKVVYDIVKDFKIKTRLSSGLGNAMLVTNSIYEACKYYELFQSTDLAEHCAVVTSYVPNIANVKGEETGAGKTEEQFKYNVYEDMLGDKKPEQFEEEVKTEFVEKPWKMRLLIVVDKLLTGFDAPPATYLYIDKPMQDHGLFQAICRVNRLHTEDKEYGYIIDYKDLFKSLEASIRDYTSGAFEGYEKEDVQGLLKDRFEQARERLDEQLDTVVALCEPVQPPRGKSEFIDYFCGDPEDKDQLKETEERRVALYKETGALARAYSDIANEMGKAGYSQEEAEDIKEQVRFYTDIRDEIKIISGDAVDLKRFEPGMRQLLDMYVEADPSRTMSALNEMTLVDLIVKRGEDAVDELPDGIKKDKEAVAETIENNLRRVINEERPSNPEYYDRMSDVLQELIRQRKKEAKEYEEYLEEIVALTKKVKRQEGEEYPDKLNTSGQKALYDNLEKDPDLALALDKAVKYVRKDGWRGNTIKEREVKREVKRVLPEEYDVEAIFDVIKNQDEY